MNDNPRLTQEGVEAARTALGDQGVADAEFPPSDWQERLLAARRTYEARRVEAEDELVRLRETFFDLISEGVGDLGLSQAEVGRLLGLPRQRVYEILADRERGVVRPLAPGWQWRKGGGE